MAKHFKKTHLGQMLFLNLPGLFSFLFCEITLLSLWFFYQCNTCGWCEERVLWLVFYSSKAQINMLCSLFFFFFNLISYRLLLFPGSTISSTTFLSTGLWNWCECVSHHFWLSIDVVTLNKSSRRGQDKVSSLYLLYSLFEPVSLSSRELCGLWLGSSLSGTV